MKSLKFVAPGAVIVDPVTGGEAILKKLESAARTCYQSQDKATEGSAEHLVRMLIDRGHHAMLEFADMTVRFTVDRGITHELVRHRLCSFAQESTRYCDYDRKGIRVIAPPGLHEDDSWRQAIEYAAQTYYSLREQGIRPEIARSVLPNCLASEIVVKANLREWRHIFVMRACNLHAHPQMREVMIPLLRAAKQLIPLVFDDLHAAA